MRKITHTGLFALFLAALAAASALGQLGHITSGHILLYVSIILLSIAALLWLVAGQSDYAKEEGLPSTPTSLPQAILEIPLNISAPSNSEAFRPLLPGQGVGGSGVPFPIGPPPWSEYTEDLFYDVIWRWHYKLEFNDAPRDLRPYCAECEVPLDTSLESEGVVDLRNETVRWLAYLRCSLHATRRVPVDHTGDFTPIKELIRKRIQDGSWQAIVARQRTARGF